MKGVYKIKFETPEGCDPVLWNLFQRVSLQAFLNDYLGENAPKVETPDVEELLKEKE